MAFADNLVSWWKLDESSGNAADSKGSNTLTNTNSTAFATGKINNGADLEASSSNYFTVADNAGLSITGDISISLWFKPESQPSASEMALVSKWRESDNNRSYQVGYAESGGNTFIRWRTSSNGTASTLKEFQTTLSNGTFYHICIVDDGANTHFYVNGTDNTTTPGADPFDGASPFRIGIDGDAGAYAYADGIIDEVGIWSRALTAAEVAILYNGGTGNTYPLSVTATPSVATAVFSAIVPAVTGGAIVSPSALSSTFSVISPTISINNWKNVDKNNATFVNIDKS